ncbi:MAG: polymerase subunit epsilon [Clostridiales bacterium]|nr:polymerase subunit epsilon [Clostridiales bacterium]
MNIKKQAQLLAFPADYSVIDIETTGLDLQNDQIIEIAALKIKQGKIVDSFDTFLSCQTPLPQKIQTLTGITEQMLSTAPHFPDVAYHYAAFLGTDILVGHSVPFDISFLSKAYKAAGYASLQNSYIDTLPISQKLLPELVHHRLKDVAAFYHFDCQGAHRAINDCRMNYQIMEAMKQTVLASFGSETQFFSQWNHLSKRIKAETIKAASRTFNSLHPFFQKRCVITGALSTLSRKQAMQSIADAGGINMDKLNTNTDILILGENTYCDLLSGISKKHKKALRLIDEGHPIKIISEQEFYTIFKTSSFAGSQGDNSSAYKTGPFPL